MRRSRASAHTGSNHCRQTGAPFRCRIRSLASIIRVLSTSSNRSEDTPEAHGIGPKDLGISRSSLDHGWSDTRTNGPRIRTERRSRRVSPRFIVSVFRTDETGATPRSHCFQREKKMRESLPRPLQQASSSLYSVNLGPSMGQGATNGAL